MLRREQREAAAGDEKAAHDGGVSRFAQSVRAWLRVAAGTERSVWSTKDGQLPHEMRRGAAEEQREAAAVVMIRRMMVGRVALLSR